MEAVMISIQQKWCNKIARGDKTIEVRKNIPKLDTPFKVYIYCTKSKKKTRIDWLDKALGGGMVIGEFICDRISAMAYTMDGFADAVDCKATCLDPVDFIRYGKGKPLYGWHISNLKIYHEPKEITDFRKQEMPTGLRYENDTITRPPQSWCYVEEA